jgi:hypothetical protein
MIVQVTVENQGNRPSSQEQFLTERARNCTKIAHRRACLNGTGSLPASPEGSWRCRFTSETDIRGRTFGFIVHIERRQRFRLGSVLYSAQLIIDGCARSILEKARLLAGPCTCLPGHSQLLTLSRPHWDLWRRWRRTVRRRRRTVSQVVRRNSVNMDRSGTKEVPHSLVFEAHERGIQRRIGGCPRQRTVAGI